MHEISPVLAGTYDNAAYAPNNVRLAAATGSDEASVAATTSTANIQTTTDTSAVDDRRYTKFDRSTTNVDADGTDFSFSDFLDTINPLQHLPVVSSIYRAATGEAINPVARVAGDILYGGVFGVASAAMGGLGAAADCMIEANTGHDSVGYIVASLFGNDDAAAKDKAAPAEGMVADAPAEPAPTGDKATAPPATTADASASPAASTSAASAATAAAGNTANTNINTPASAHAARAYNMNTQKAAPAAPANTNTTTNIPIAQGDNGARAYPLDRSKMPYGGVMAPVNSQETQMMAAVAASKNYNMQQFNRLSANRLTTAASTAAAANAASSPTATSTPALSTAATLTNPTLAAQAAAQAASRATAMDDIAAAQATNGINMQAIAVNNATASSNAGSAKALATGKNQLPQQLINDMMMKSLNQYQSTAGSQSLSGAMSLGN